jgi:transcription initiation factor TFIIIB Brf1 subunit/transcription initiation factor TFIIB
MKKLLSLVFLLALSLPTLAQIDQPKEIKTSQQFGAYTVHYNVFNSKSIPAEVAKIYQLTRSKDMALVNISLTKTEHNATSLGLPAKVSVKAINLMQQTKTLEFKTIKESDNGASVTYYLAPFRHTNEEDIRFEVSVLPEGETKPLTVSFTRRLFTEN